MSNPPGRCLALPLVVLLVAGMLLIPAVSAESLIDSGVNSAAFTHPTAEEYRSEIEEITFYDIAEWQGLKNVYIKGFLYTGSNDILIENPSYSMPVTAKIGTTVIGTGEAGYNGFFDSEGNPTGVQCWVDFDTWDIGSRTGTQSVVLIAESGTLFNGIKIRLGPLGSEGYTSPEKPAGFSIQNGRLLSGSHIVRASYYWENAVEDTGESMILTRIIDGTPYQSNLMLNYGTTTITDNRAVDIEIPYAGTGTWNVTTPYGRIYSGILGSDPSDSPPVTVYIRNSQTGALLANSHLSILAAAGGTETEIINATLPGGVGVYTLQPTGGGSPNPDYYRAVASVPGFSQIIENHSFTLNGPHDVIIEMRPDTGGPTDPERCYLEFYVRDLNANPIPAASIQCGGRILQTNSAGYAVFEVSKNSTHPWIAKKSGYVTIEGTATVGPNPRYTVNVVLGPGTVPTNPPATDPGGPGATPTPDRRTNEQKGQAVIDLIADFAEPIALLAIVATVFGLMQMMMPRRR